jgi:hypothetical protein
MSPATDTIRPALPTRRTPSSGVSGVTLLMLVTLVLTTSPALGKARDAVSSAQPLQDLTAAPRIGNPRAEPRIGGRREQASRETRPSSGEAITQPAAAIDKSGFLAESPRIPSGDSDPAPTARIRVALLNLPPPLA